MLLRSFSLTRSSLFVQIHEEHPENLEALQYLEALCKDIGRNHEEYSRKLEKLRRSQPQQINTQAAGMTRAGGPAPAAPPQRTERAQPQRSERPSAASTTAVAASSDRGAATRALEEFPDSAGAR